MKRGMPMKRGIIAILLVLMLAACAQDLPPTPPPPGGSVGAAIAGLAVLPTWAAMPKDAVMTPSEGFYGDSLVLSVSNYDYVYKNAYLYNSNVRTWQRMTLQGEEAGDWLRGSGVGTITLNEQMFAPGENFVVVYACTKAGGWSCNSNRWMLVKFMVNERTTTVIAEAALIDQFVENKNIVPFSVSGLDAQYDDFEGTPVVRYDANYREKGGLLVVVHVFDFKSRADLDNTMKTLFKDIVNQGWKQHAGNNVAVFLAENDHRIAVWTSGRALVYIETHDSAAANKEIIEAYLRKYPSDLKKIV